MIHLRRAFQRFSRRKPAPMQTITVVCCQLDSREIARSVARTALRTERNGGLGRS